MLWSRLQWQQELLQEFTAEAIDWTCVFMSAAGLLVSVEVTRGLALGAIIRRFLRGGPCGSIPVNKYELGHHIARRLRAKFWPDCAILDTSMKFGTVVDHDWLSRIGYRTTLGNAHSACAKHCLILGCYHRAFIQLDFKEGVMLAVE